MRFCHTGVFSIKKAMRSAILKFLVKKATRAQILKYLVTKGKADCHSREILKYL